MCNCLFCLTPGGARCCAIFSFLGVCFLVFMGILLTYQPQYIHGFGNPTTAATGAHNAWFGSLMYFACFLLALFMFKYRTQEELNKKRKLGSEDSEVEMEGVRLPKGTADNSIILS